MKVLQIKIAIKKRRKAKEAKIHDQHEVSKEHTSQ